MECNEKVINHNNIDFNEQGYGGYPKTLYDQNGFQHNLDLCGQMDFMGRYTYSDGVRTKERGVQVVDLLFIVYHLQPLP